MQIRTQEDLFRGPVKIRQLTEKGIRVSKIFSGEKIKVIFDGEIIRKNDIVEITGNIFVDKLVECIRCLEEFHLNVSESINIHLKPSYTLLREEEIELKFEDLDDDFYEGDEFDFYQYIISLGESIIPPYNLCSEECKGICQKCGNNLNTEGCKCTSGSNEKSKIADFLPTNKKE